MMKIFNLLFDLMREWIELMIKQSRRIRWVLAKRIRATVTVNTRHGRLTFPTRDSEISAGLYLSRQYEYDDSIRFIRFLESRDGVLNEKPRVIYDIGANIGFIGIGLVNAGLFDYAVSFEPEPRNFDMLQRNIKQNSLGDRIFPVNAALTERARELEMELSEINHGDHRIRTAAARIKAEQGEEQRRTVRVPGMRLDELPWDKLGVPVAARKPSVLWMDVQGFEGYVLSGATGLLAEGVPAVMEISPYCILRAGMSLDDFSALLQKHWNTFWVPRPWRMVPYQTSYFPEFLKELGTDSGSYTNIAVTNEPQDKNQL